MAIVTLGNLIGQARGSIGGLTFSNSRSGPFIRTRRGPAQATTNPQANARSLFSNAAAHWRNQLTNDQRAAWNTLAASTPFDNALGNKMYLSGFSLYIRNNAIRPLLELNFLTEPPSTAICEPILCYPTLIGDPPAWTIGLNPAPPAGDLWHTLVSFSRPHPFSVTAPHQPFHNSTIWDTAHSATFPPILTAECPPSYDNRFFFRFRTAWDEGQTSEQYTISQLDEPPS